MNVAVPDDQHSPMLGQRASSQTVASEFFLRMLLMRMNVSPPGARTLSQDGFLGDLVLAVLDGMFPFRLPA
jgi:hypothetical protein